MIERKIYKKRENKENITRIQFQQPKTYHTTTHEYYVNIQR